MNSRKQLHQQIDELSGKLKQVNSLLEGSNNLSMLDIDLLRKTTIDIYEAVNHLRLVKNETADIVDSADVADFLSADFSDEKSLGANKYSHESANGTANENPVDTKHDLSESADDIANETLVSSNNSPITEEENIENEKNEEIIPEAEITVEPEPEPEIIEIEKSEVAKDFSPEVIEFEEPTAEAKDFSSETQLDSENTNPAEMNEPSPEPKEEIIPEAEEKSEIPVSSRTPYTPENKNLASKLGGATIPDLKKHISIGKKFEFISSLFKGNHEQYTYAIHHLNNMSNGDEAFQYLNSLRKEHLWDEESTIYLELADLVRRRFLG